MTPRPHQPAGHLLRGRETLTGARIPLYSMAEQDGDAGQMPPDSVPSYSNSWDGTCVAAANENDHTGISGTLDREDDSCSRHSINKEVSLVQGVMKMEQSMDGVDVPHGGASEQPEPLGTQQPDSFDEVDLWDVQDNKQALPLNSNQCNFNIGETCDAEDMHFPLSASYRRQPKCVIMRMGSVLSVPLKNMLTNQFEELSLDFTPGQQEDAHEFLRCLLDNLHECTLDPKSKSKGSSFEEESIVKEIFGGQLKSHLSCCECGHSSETFEPFLDLSLEIDQVDHLVDALQSFTKVEQVGDSENKLTCESCNARVCKNKQLTLYRAPDVIAFHLKRFTTLDNSVKKIDKYVAYPLEVDLKPFHSNPETVGELKYDLYGVVEHSGLPNYGHYVCTIRSSPSTWYLMNDSNVDSITDSSALNQEAYILFYVRQGKFPWFSSLLEGKVVLQAENTCGTSPVSVLENIDVNCSTSSGGGSSSSSGDKLEKNEASQLEETKKDETSQYKTSFLPDEPSKSSFGASNSNNAMDEDNPPRVSFQNSVASCSRSVETTNLEKPSTPRCSQRLASHDEFSVFEFEDFDEEKETLLPKLKFPSKVKKANSASRAMKGRCIDQNAVRLMRSMTSTRRKGLIDCIAQQTAKHESNRCPASDPLDKKKRKLVLQY
ncbi:Ubiquitin carboxyl-terminal hydrolase 21 [Zea mays]|uniref:Ubiquitin carboxyl-terminal hydrolase 21 n=2 Tax=Zea mays TaxID=4577 RepID=A0A3L6ETV1_MAIZE|nr:hypothetical protein Zm00014a_035482 [Zea mays]PWZ24129.1 Ubiquitin carboxyl-terminal hydrolase 21 [Zea mays]